MVGSPTESATRLNGSWCDLPPTPPRPRERWPRSFATLSAMTDRSLHPTGREIGFWIGLYALLAALPLVAVVVRPVPEGRGFWIEFAVALGFVALAMLGLQFALTARFRRIASPFGVDILLHFHRQAGLVAFALALAHPLILIFAYPPYLEYLDPRSSVPRAFALWVVVGSLLLLIGATLWRKRLGFAYEWWRATHGILSLIVVFIGLVHVLQVGHYISVPWKQGLWVLMTGGAMALLVQARLIKPLQLRRSPYRVVEVRPERGESWTLALEAVGHPGLRFGAGQFGWLTLGPTPFSLQQHPFSFSSSAERPERLEFTVKELGDFTETIGSVEVGTTAFVEGPYGAFELDPGATGAVFVVGGVGVTPVMSMLRTLHDQRDPRSLLLIYGNTDWEDVIFREEIPEIEKGLDLRVVHVLEEPPDGWAGEAGLIDDALLGRHLPARIPDGCEFFVCGPAPMMDGVERSLLERGVAMRRVKSERFDIA